MAQHAGEARLERPCHRRGVRQAPQVLAGIARAREHICASVLHAHKVSCSRYAGETPLECVETQMKLHLCYVSSPGRHHGAVRTQHSRSCRHSDHNLLLLGPPGAGKSRLARRLTTILPAMTLAEAIETTRIHRVAGLTGRRTALITTRPFRTPHHTISDVGRIGGARCRCRATCRWRITAYSCSMNCRSSAAMSWRSCASRSRMVSSTYNFAHVLNLNAFAALAARLMIARGSDRGS
jgi:Magnesium chelatase, subunit ChlI